MGKILVSAAALAMVMMVGSTAMAKDAKKKIETVEEGDGYGYNFEDDLVGAGVMGAQNGLIKVRQGVVRRTLIRPRTHFVPELLKSIELI